mmetsp:Transcript_101390/g.286012  ORF Transcript_101390/g.286012 Transcript_101390/m.286012 type:complete len:147 (+) Transcript_101390:129-569(+)|eukprot:CAMPEP_0117521178 /NCGR_PEP_ID=MMETSP0784-20121206/33551_1 /TAXON_ID=39447 /ORGANISM="" /LENGTH=146 /DNA_ID=CAMNT_0005317197 /DNA_START=118 /DNA_END=558 /DNA_ORIENTATION=-
MSEPNPVKDAVRKAEERLNEMRKAGIAPSQSPKRGQLSTASSSPGNAFAYGMPPASVDEERGTPSNGLDCQRISYEQQDPERDGERMTLGSLIGSNNPTPSKGLSCQRADYNFQDPESSGERMTLDSNGGERKTMDSIAEAGQKQS